MKKVSLIVVLLAAFAWIYWGNFQNSTVTGTAIEAPTGNNMPVPSSSLVPSARPPSSPPEREVHPQSSDREYADFLDRFPGDWLFSQNEEGQLMSITGGSIALPDLSPQSIKNAAADIVASLGFDPQQLSSDYSEPAETRFGKNFRFLQEAKGYQVYGSSLQFYVAKNNNAISIIDPALKRIESFNLKRNISSDEARQRVLDANGPDARESFPGATLLYVNEGQAQLAYQVIVESPDFDKEFIVSAETGDVLYEQSLRVQ